MPIKYVMRSHGEAPLKIWADEVEDSAMLQLHNAAKLPFIHSHIAAMPDAHWGMGTTVGSVIPTIKALVPAAVGVDIGCGMMAVKLGLKAHQLPDSLAPMRHAIESAVPHGRTNDGREGDRGAWHTPPESVKEAWLKLYAQPRFTKLLQGYQDLFSARRLRAGNAQLGTLGTGNHFVEVCLDTEQNVWVMLHSGSRGIGNAIGSHFISKAKELMERYHIALPDPNLAYIPEAEPIFQDYWMALDWAQQYASQNRQLMMSATLQAIEDVLDNGELAREGTAVNCHHNYVAVENHFGRNCYVTRKGAVRAREGDLGIIPGSMGAKSFIVCGKGNPDAFSSCSHGAGRKMSRTEAERRFTVADVESQTSGVECRKDAGVIDEIPAAYKDIDQVMANQSDLVDVVATLKQVLCVKG